MLSENKCGTIFLYNGEYGVSTDENGLYYMRARYYNPEIKRFINQDVVIGSIVDSPSLNRYAYVEGNPISLADPFGLSPGIDWRGAAHFLLGGLSLLTLIPTPVTYIIGAAASIANAALYAEEGNYFAAICNAIPVFGGGFSLLGKAGNASCWLMKTLQYSTAGLSIGVGTYDIYQIGKGNYQKYVVRGEDFSLGDMFSDLFRGAMDVVSIAGGAKLASEKISYCFVAGTLVTTEDGQKPIEEIQIGDKVLSENPETGEIAYKTVEETYINETDELIHVHVNGETISATPNHPFYVDKLGWTLAKNLRAGDVLVLSNGEYVVIEWIQHEILESPIKVYNFEVEDFHTYFVGESSVLVHNDCTEEARRNKLSPALEDSPYHPDEVEKRIATSREYYKNFVDTSTSGRMTTSQATEAAKKLGYEKTNSISHGQAIYYNPKNKKYITPDVDSHNGGVWKMAKSIEELSSRGTRMGTYDEFLNRIGD